ncbi:MAG: type II secretion system F family protein [Rhodoluna sp.]
MIPILFSAGLVTTGFLLAGNSLNSFRRKNLRQRILAEQNPIANAVPLLQKLTALLSIEKADRLALLFSMPDVLDLLAMAMLSGESIFSALSRVVPRASGPFAIELRKMLSALELGSTYEEELQSMSKRVNQRQVSEFANKLSLTISRGTPIATMLGEQSDAIRHEINNQLIKQAGKNETKMLIPLVFLILPVTILFAIYPSLQLLDINYL